MMDHTGQLENIPLFGQTCAEFFEVPLEQLLAFPNLPEELSNKVMWGRYRVDWNISFDPVRVAAKFSCRGITICNLQDLQLMG